MVLKRLEEMGVANDTIVIHSTDNGVGHSTFPHGGTTPFRSEKMTTWEGGVRVCDDACVLTWPNQAWNLPERHSEPRGSLRDLLGSCRRAGHSGTDRRRRRPGNRRGTQKPHRWREQSRLLDRQNRNFGQRRIHLRFRIAYSGHSDQPVKDALNRSRRLLRGIDKARKSASVQRASGLVRKLRSGARPPCDSDSAENMAVQCGHGQGGPAHGGVEAITAQAEGLQPERGQLKPAPALAIETSKRIAGACLVRR